MGFLSSIFGRHEEPEETVEAEQDRETQHEQRTRFPDLHMGMTLHVSIDKGDSLLTGRLTAFSDDELTIERQPGQLSFDTCPVGADVVVRGYRETTMPVDLKGTIAESSRVKCRVKDLAVIPYNESRANFRLVLHTPISLYDPDDTLMGNPEECELVDISVTGACFQSEYIHCEGEVLRMKVQIEDYVPRILLGQIVRVESLPDNKFRYGFLFAQLEDREADSLTRELFNVQLGKKREHKRDGLGHW